MRLSAMHRPWQPGCFDHSRADQAIRGTHHDPSAFIARDYHRLSRNARCTVSQTVQKLTFYYPIAVGGPLQAIMDGYCKDFQKETGIAVEPVYSGDYSQTLIKALAAIKAGTGPQFAVLLAAEMHSLQDQDILDLARRDRPRCRWQEVDQQFLSRLPRQQPC